MPIETVTPANSSVMEQLKIQSEFLAVLESNIGGLRSRLDLILNPQVNPTSERVEILDSAKTSTEATLINLLRNSNDAIIHLADQIVSLSNRVAL